jgi:3-oxoacyl-[acyl-carrier-protein] synthase II
MQQPRVVITGVGMLTALGNDVASTWQALCQGQSGVGSITSYDSAPFRVHFAAEVQNFDPQHYMDYKEARRNEPYTHFAIAAAKQALEQAQLVVTAENAEEIGVCIGGCLGGLTVFYNTYATLVERGPARISPYSIHLMIANTAPAVVSIITGAQGPNFALAAAHATGSNTIGEGWEIIRRGDAKAMIVGGSEKGVVPMAMAAFDNMGALSRNNDDPQGACRPFDAHRDGFVMGEGAGVLILEELEFARARNAPILAEVVGYGTATDAYHVTRPQPEGRGLTRAIQSALRKAALRPDEVDYINAHGTSTPCNDRIETRAIKTSFGDHARNLLISATKSMLGHTLGAAGAIGTIVSVLTIRDGMVHPTINLRHPDPACDLDYVPNLARQANVEVALVNAVGFGGHNTALLIRRFRD